MILGLTMSKKIKGKTFGDWQARKFLGEGGNGEVWLASNSSEKAAIKLLTKLDDNKGEKIYARFKDEVKVVNENSDIEGLLPIIDSHLPEEIGEDTPWYVMPVAQPVEECLDGRSFEAAIQIVVKVGETLTKLHERNICHRDIKPQNILVRENVYYLSDFGLVDYPDKQELTGTGERIGARWTVAPEMERDSQNADGKPADVYSLAKTLWILLTGQRFSFEGQYNPDSVNGLRNLQLTEPENEDFFLFRSSSLLYLTPLDKLMRDSTNDAPSQRPNMSQFVGRLESWVQMYKDFKKRIPLQWQEIQEKLFPLVLPQRAIWEDIEAITEILNLLSSSNGLNHMHLPDGGGMDLLEACLGDEIDTIELIVYERVAYIVKPKRLIFESFGFDTEWNYFRLETGELEPTGLTFVYRDCETLRELAPLNYVSEDEWDNDRDNEKSYPADARLIKRYMRGDCLIIQQTSLYNRSGYTYVGNHNLMDSDSFRHYITKKIQLVKVLLSDRQFLKEVSVRNYDLVDAIFYYLEDVYRQEYLAKNKDKGLNV